MVRWKRLIHCIAWLKRNYGYIYSIYKCICSFIDFFYFVISTIFMVVAFICFDKLQPYSEHTYILNILTNSNHTLNILTYWTYLLSHMANVSVKHVISGGLHATHDSTFYTYHACGWYVFKQMNEWKLWFIKNMSKLMCFILFYKQFIIYCFTSYFSFLIILAL